MFCVIEVPSLGDLICLMRNKGRVLLSDGWCSNSINLLALIKRSHVCILNEIEQEISLSTEVFGFLPSVWFTPDGCLSIACVSKGLKTLSEKLK